MTYIHQKHYAILKKEIRCVKVNVVNSMLQEVLRQFEKAGLRTTTKSEFYPLN